MASKIDIANIALGYLGADFISDVSENTKAARTITAHYDIARDATLAEHPWNFAIKRAVLNPDVQTPIYGYGYQFTLPSDCIRVLEFTDGKRQLDFKIEAAGLLSDSNLGYIKYIYRVTAENLFSPPFVQAFACRLAYEIAFTITQSSTAVENRFGLYEKQIALSRSIDAQEGTPQQIDEYAGSTWIEARN